MKKFSEIRNLTTHLLSSIMILMVCLTLAHSFVNASGYEVEYYSIARNVDKGIPSGEPLFETDSGLGAVFLTTDSYVYSYIRFKEVSSPFILRTDWYAPDGQLYATTEVKDETSKTYSGLWAWSRIQIAGKIDEEGTGLWVVKVYLNDQPIVVSRFLILTPYQVWRLVEICDEMREANQALENSVSDYEQKLLELGNKVTVLESKNTELELKNQGLENDLADAETRYDALSEEYSKILSDRDSLRLEMSSLQEKLENAQAEIDSLNLQRLSALTIAIASASIAILLIALKRRKA